MGSSLILKGGASTPKTVLETIIRANSFVSGDVVRYDPSVGAAGTWYRSQANSAENAEVVGVVQNASATSFDVVYSGFISLSGYAGVSAPVLFLSAEVPGGLTSSPPSALGTVVKPVLTRTTTGGGYVVTNYLGTQIGGSSTISVDEIQPVGAVMPFAGSVIPETWLECTGASYAVVDYPELYLKLQNSSGDRAPAHGYVVQIGVNTTTYATWFSSVAVGDTILYSLTQADLTVASVTTYSLIGRVIAKGTASVTVQIFEKYVQDTGLKNSRFEYPNVIPSTSGWVAAFLPVANTTIYDNLNSSQRRSNTAGQPVAAVSTVAVTHFNTPDLRGRFAIGTNTSNLGELESDGNNYSAIAGLYPLGSQGGQEVTPAGTGVQLKADSPNAFVTPGTNGLVANMPPYTAVRYIIKAKPYTRAAIIDDIDIPYGNLLIRDLRTRLLGGSNSDLVFHTNTSGDSGLGTERMRLSNAGYLGIGTDVPAAPLSVCTSGGGGLEIVPAGGSSITQAYNRATAQYIENVLRGSVLSFYTGQTTTERMRIDANGRVGIGDGAISPDRKLTVASSTAVSTAINIKNSAATGNGLLLECDASANTFVWNYSPTPMLFATSGIERVRITAGGNVGIGLGGGGTPLYRLHVQTDGQLQGQIAFSSSTLGGSAVLGHDLNGNAFFYETANKSLAIGTNNTERMRISADGFVGIAATPTSAYRLSVTGKIYASDDIVAFSDARYKRDISPIADSLNKVRSLVGVLYTDSNGNRKTGLLAQDVQTVLPEAVSTDEAGNLALAYGNLVGLLVEAVKELTTRVHELEKR
jgi:hypothetical protein